MHEHCWTLPTEEIISDNELNRFRDIMDKAQGRDNTPGTFLKFEVALQQIGSPTLTIYNKVVRAALAYLPSKCTDNYHMFYQINAQAENGIGETLVTRRARRDYTVLFAITRLDLWINTSNQKLA